MMTAASLSRSRSRGYYFSRLLKEYFGKNKTRLSYPAFLLFLVEEGRVRYCRLIPLPRASLEKTYEHLSALFPAIASGIEEVCGPDLSSGDLWEHLKTKLLDLRYRLRTLRPPADAEETVRKLSAYVEE